MLPDQKAKAVFVSFFFLTFTLLFFWKVVFLGRIFLPYDNLFQYYPWKGIANLAPHNYLLSDLALQYYPFKLFFKQAITQGQFPLWNPYILCGMSLISDIPIAVFYPFNLLFLLTDVKVMSGYALILHIFLAQLFMYLFLRALRISVLGAMLGAICFSFSGFVVGHMVHPMIINVLIWLPLLLWSIENVFSTQKHIYIIAGAAVFGMQLLAGHLEISFHIILAFILFSLFKLLQLYKNSHNVHVVCKNFNSLATIFIIGCLIASIQLLPALKYGFLYSARKNLLSYQDIIKGAMEIKHLLVFIIPNFFGNPIHNNYITKVNYTEYSAYIGLLPLALAFLGIYNRRVKERFFFMLLAILSLTFALGGPFYKLLYLTIPGFNQLRSPFRFLSLYVFCASVLCATGFDWLFMKKGRIKHFSNWLLVFLLTLGIVLIFMYVFRDYMIRILQIFTRRLYLIYHYELKNLFRLFILMLCNSILFLALQKCKCKTVVFKTVVIIAVFIDLFIFGASYNSSVAKKLFLLKPEAMEMLQKDTSVYRISGFSNKEIILPANTNLYWQLCDNRGYNSLIYAPYADFINLIDPQSVALMYNKIWEFKQKGALLSPLVDFLNIKYIFADQDIIDSKFALVYDKQFKIYRNTKVLPRAFVVHKVKVLSNKASQLAYLKSNDFDPRRIAVVDTQSPIHLSGNSINDETASITSYKPNIVKMEVILHEAGLLVFSDVNYPGWRVYVDGKLTPITNVNYIFRGVYLKEGKHNIIFSFVPNDFEIGIVLSSIGLISLIFIGIKKTGNKK